MSDEYAIEPWAVKPSTKQGSGVNHISTAQNGLIANTWRDPEGSNANRIINCVNFCAGVDNQLIGSLKPLRQLIMENTALQEAVTDLMKLISHLPENVDVSVEGSIAFDRAKRSFDAYLEIGKRFEEIAKTESDVIKVKPILDSAT
jgi:hypothetical protein